MSIGSGQTGLNEQAGLNAQTGLNEQNTLNRQIESQQPNRARDGGHKIAVLSDTHSLLRAEVREILQGCEAILHAGDIASREVYEEICGIAPAYFVRGNADREWAEKIPSELDVELCGYHFYMVHNKKHMRQDLSGVDFVIYGHSHKYEERCGDGVVYLNPGSCGPRRFTQPVTMAVLQLEESPRTYSIHRIDFTASPTKGKAANMDAAKANVTGPDMAEMETAGMEIAEMDMAEMETAGKLQVAMLSHSQDMDRLIRAIIKDMHANRAVDKIAARNKVPVDFVNQILQIYTTHPGIDVDGIMNRMDIWGK